MLFITHFFCFLCIVLHTLLQRMSTISLFISFPSCQYSLHPFCLPLWSPFTFLDSVVTHVCVLTSENLKVGTTKKKEKCDVHLSGLFYFTQHSNSKFYPLIHCKFHEYFLKLNISLCICIAFLLSIYQLEDI